MKFTINIIQTTNHTLSYTEVKNENIMDKRLVKGKCNYMLHNDCNTTVMICSDIEEFKLLWLYKAVIS